MKRLICIGFLLVFLLTGCSELAKPPNLSSPCYKIGINVLSVTDDYLDKKISPAIAAAQIQDQCRSLSKLPDELGPQDQQVKNYCEMLSYTIMLVADGDFLNEKEILNTRNTLATLLKQDIKSEN